MKRPTIKARPNDPHTLARLAEISFPDGRGCLLSLAFGADGHAIIEIFRADPGIEIRLPACDPETGLTLGK